MLRNVNRREFLRRCAEGSGALSLAAPLAPYLFAEGKTRPTNVLWLVAEDLSPDLGCYGHPLVKTPALDRLAKEGIRYTRAFSTAPVCSPSRSAFMTGMYQTSIGAHQHRTLNRKPLPEGVDVITRWFREAGYFTSNGYGDRWNRRGKQDFNFTTESPPFDGTDWRQRKEGQSFFSVVQFHETHRTFKRDPEHPVDPGAVSFPPCYPDHPVTRRDWADYLECVQVLDRKVGQVLRRLEEDGLAENTAVFFFADHGRPHVWGKQWLYDEGIRVPLIVRLPGGRAAGTRSDRLVSLLDLAPASLGLAGVDPPLHFQGRDFLGTGEPMQYIVAARDRCDETFDRIRCVRTARYKYIRNFFPQYPYMQPNLYKIRSYPVWSLLQVLNGRGALNPAQQRFMAPCRPDEELYDLEKDPHETKNLAGSKEHAPVLRKLREDLDRWISATRDRGEVTEDPKVAAESLRRLDRPNTERVMKKRGLPLDVDPAAFLAWWEKELAV